MHFFVRLEPLPNKEAEFREELLRVIEATRSESGCVSIRAFESLREPFTFAIHSEWADEAALEMHSQLPHTLRFVRATEELLTHDLKGVRTREIGGWLGADSSA